MDARRHAPRAQRHGSTALQPRRRQTHHSVTFTAEPHPGLCSPREGGKGMRRAGRRQCRDIQRHDGGARSDRVTHTLSAHGTWSRAHHSARDRSRACTRRRRQHRGQHYLHDPPLCPVPLPRARCHPAARRPRDCGTAGSRIAPVMWPVWLLDSCPSSFQQKPKKLFFSKITPARSVVARPLSHKMAFSKSFARYQITRFTLQQIFSRRTFQKTA